MVAWQWSTPATEWKASHRNNWSRLALISSVCPSLVRWKRSPSVWEASKCAPTVVLTTCNCSSANDRFIRDRCGSYCLIFLLNCGPLIPSRVFSMAAPASPTPEERGPNSKRMKGDDTQAMPVEEPNYNRPPSSQPQRYMPPQPYPMQSGPPMQPYWGQYNGPSGPWPPQGPPGGPPPPPPPGMYGDRDWNFRNGPKPVMMNGTKKDGDDDSKSNRGPMPPYPGWTPQNPGPWNHPQYGPPPPWQSGPPPPGPPGPMYPGWSKSPVRGRPPPEMMPGFGRADIDMSYLNSRSGGAPMDDDGAGSSAGGSAKEKGRGSYKCGRVSAGGKEHRKSCVVLRLTK